MPVFLRGLFGLLGRLLLTAIFLASAIAGKIMHYQDTIGQMDKHHVPYPQVLLPGAIVFLLVGSFSVIVGMKARFGALLLLIFLGLATYYFHNFWVYAPTSPEYMDMQVHFMKNLSMAGALLYIIGNGSGYWSLDRREV